MNRIIEQVKSGEFDPVVMFTGDKDKFLEVKAAIENISNDLNKDTCIKILLIKIIPTLFDKSVDNTVRDKTVDIGLQILKFLNVSFLDFKDQESIFTSIEETYSQTIGELRDNNYANWDKLWIFLVRLCHIKLHSRMSLTNKLLRVVEVAFRNSISVEQRLKAYDCWAELIDNSSLNTDHMCSAKQIKLLMTPMKAKFSRMPIVIMKRCSTFVYLLEKLQDRGTLCLKEFLEFCFGPFEENDVEKMRQGRSVPDVCITSTKVFMALIGHSHDENEICIESDAIKLQKPLIGKENFPSFADILINSAVECCILLDEWNKDSCSVNMIISCLWRTLLHLINQSSEEVKRKCCIQINNALGKILQRAECNIHFYVVLGNMVELFIQDEMKNSLKDVLFDVCMNLLKNNSPKSCPFDEENIVKFVNSCFGMDASSKFDKTASSYFRSDTKSANSSLLCGVWMKCNFTASSGNVSHLIWPIRHLQHFKDMKLFQSKWTRLYNIECKSELVKTVLMQEVEKLFLENPLLSSNVVTFLQLISITEYNSSKDFVARFMRLVEVVLTLPNLSHTDIGKMSSMVLSYCNQNQYFYKTDNIEEALDKLCGCLQHLITIHKDYNILSDLATCLQEGQPKYLPKFSKRLFPLLETLMLKEDDFIATSARKLMELLQTKENGFEPVSLTSTRSLRLVNMANRTLKSGKLNIHRLKNTPPLPIRSSPRVRGRNIESKMKTKGTVEINEDKSEDYVKVNTEVNFNFNNLNEHQREMFKRRREDIPALYQDLSQSQSKDVFNNFDSVSNGVKENSVRLNQNSKEEQKHANPKSTSLKKVKKDKNELVCSDKAVEESEGTVNTNHKRDEAENAETNLNCMEPSKGVVKIHDDGRSTDEPIALELRDSCPFDSDQILTTTQEEQTLDTTGTLTESTTPETLKDKGHRDSRRKTTRWGRKSRNSKIKHVPLIESKVTVNGNFPLVNDASSSIESQVDLQQENSIGGDLLDLGETSIEAKEDNTENSNFVETPLRKSQRQINKRVSVNETQHRSLESKKNEKPNTTLPDQEKDAIKKIIQKLVRKSKKELNRQANDEDLLVDTDVKKEEPLQEVVQSDTSTEEDKINIDVENKIAWEDGNQNNIGCFDMTKGLEFESNSNIGKTTNEVLQIVATEEVVENAGDDQHAAFKKTDYVCEFKGDKGVMPVDDKKRKKRQRRLYLNNKDYVSKRRKKVKRSTKEKTLVFHVTADCSTPVPLSKSPSLRAVPSPESETITILITRSPPVPENSPKGPDDSLSKINGDSPSPKRRTRSSNPLSEDVIESSQASPQTSKKMSTTPKNSQFARSIQFDGKKCDMPLSTHNKEDFLPDTETLSVEPLGIERDHPEMSTPKVLKIMRRFSLTDAPTQKIRLAMRKARSKSLDKVDYVLSNTSNGELPQAQPLLPNAKLQESDTDTVTLSSVAEEFQEKLPSSPVTYDTPDRALELFNNTSDISPINLTPEEVHTPVRPQTSNEITNRRAAKVLQMVNPDFQVTDRKWFGIKQSSANKRNLRKMMVKKEEQLDILTFSREVPSPLIIPATGILKRKLENLDETGMPSPKRKRVNFSDPAITAKKIFIKDTNEYDMDDTEKINSASIDQDEFDDVGEVVDKETNCEKTFDEDASKEDVLLGIKELCDANLRNKCVDDSNVKNALGELLQNLKITEITDVISEYLEDLNDSTMEQVNAALIENGALIPIIDKCVVPLIQKEEVFDIFLSKLLIVLGNLSNSKLQYFIGEITKVFGSHLNNSILTSKVLEEQIESFIINKFDCDRMNGLIKNYLVSMDASSRNNFLVNLFNLCSNELPPTKEFASYHTSVLQNFIARMPD